MAHAPVQQSSAPEDASPIYAEIERLKKLKETYGWNVKHWDYASDLFDVWLSHDDREPEPNYTPLHPMACWLWDI
ncbi:hypothetical protein SynRS9915_01317 [Synechococcus sp. RS9915]|nr:hypothetical protein SynRS9915_01317 [Synechococcus sp. RS9915]